MGINTEMGRARRAENRRLRGNAMANVPKVKIFCSFEYENDQGRKGSFIHQAEQYGGLRIHDLSLNRHSPDDRWRQDVKQRLAQADVMVIVLGPDTHNAPGVGDELSLAGQAGVPYFQAKPQHTNYGLVGRAIETQQTLWKNLGPYLASHANRAKRKRP